MKNIFLNGLCLLVALNVSGQVPASRITDWSKAGMQDTIPAYSNVLNILNYGGSGNGTTPNDNAILLAMTALNGQPGVIYFPTGDYLFNQSVNLDDNMVLRGVGKDSSKLFFDLGGNFQNMINIAGSTGSTIWNVTQPAAKNDTVLVLNTASGLAIGDWVIIYGNDSSIINDIWAYETVGQIFRIKNIAGTTITSDQVLRREYTTTFAPRIKKITPVSGVGIECLRLERLDSTAAQTYNINLLNAVNCWVTGVESDSTNFAHIAATSSAHILIRGNYLHHSHDYGGGGQGYGVLLQYTSGDILVENNVFEHLRHSMLLQAGANGNVFAYNYSTDPYWIEPSLPANSAGDAVLHGNYPYLNLFEGNIVQNIIIDNSHDINGPFNTFFRNRAQLYGIFQNTGVGATDSINYIGNEVTNNSLGFYSLAGTGHFQYGNIIKGTITPTGTVALTENSLYRDTPPGYWDAHQSWPHIGYMAYYNNQWPITAQLNHSSSVFTDCRSNPKYVGVKELNKTVFVKVYPNPVYDQVVFESDKDLRNVTFTVTDVMGRVVHSETAHSKSKLIVEVKNWPAGIYLYNLQYEAGIISAGKISVQ